MISELRRLGSSFSNLSFGCDTDLAPSDMSKAIILAECGMD